MTQVDFYDKGQVDNLLEGKADATSVGAETDQASETGSLWARIKYVLGHWMTRDTEQTVTGKKVFSGGAEVPTTPATAASAVNSVYVNDATEGVNNIVHKTGNERISGTKYYDNDYVKISQSVNATEVPSQNGNFGVIRFTSPDLSHEGGAITVRKYSDGRTRMYLITSYWNGTNNIESVLEININQLTGEKFAQTDYRTTGYTDRDIVTIGTLRALGLIQ